MRLLGFEITKVPKHENTVWVRSSVAPLGMRITDMTPEEMRRELTWVVSQLSIGRVLHVGRIDTFRRIQSSKPNPYYTKE